MAVFQFSALSDGQAISFDPDDVLNFDRTAIAAADLRVTTTCQANRDLAATGITLI